MHLIPGVQSQGRAPSPTATQVPVWASALNHRWGNARGHTELPGGWRSGAQALRQLPLGGTSYGTAGCTRELRPGHS